GAARPVGPSRSAGRAMAARRCIGNHRSLGRDQPFAVTASARRVPRRRAPPPGPAIAEVAAILATWIDGLADRSRPLCELDATIVAALQADVAFGAHV